MPTVIEQNLGRVIPFYRGTYSVASQYIELDEVTYDGIIYRVKKNAVPAVGTLPTNTIYWELSNRYQTNEITIIENIQLSGMLSTVINLTPNYNKVLIEVNVMLSKPSTIIVDVKNDGTNVFPTPQQYTTDYYTTDGNNNEWVFDVSLINYNKSQVRTRMLVEGYGFLDEDFTRIENVLVSPVAGICNAVNIVALNGAEMTGTIVVKKIKYVNEGN